MVDRAGKRVQHVGNMLPYSAAVAAPVALPVAEAFRRDAKFQKSRPYYVRFIGRRFRLFMFLVLHQKVFF